jgi:hypothetical protein
LTANYGLSLSYNPKTGFTNALLYGNDLLTADDSYGTGLGCQSRQIAPLIESAASLWSHPALLPTALLSNHLSRMEYVLEHVMEARVYAVENRLGASRAGRLYGKSDANGYIVGSKSIREAKHNIRQSTGTMSTVLTDVLFLIHVAQWENEYAEFLAQVVQEMIPVLSPGTCRSTVELQESIRYMCQGARAVKGYYGLLKLRMESQLNIVNSTTFVKLRHLLTGSHAALQLDSPDRQPPERPHGGRNGQRQRGHEDACLPNRRVPPRDFCCS